MFRNVRRVTEKNGLAPWPRRMDGNGKESRCISSARHKAAGPKRLFCSNGKNFLALDLDLDAERAVECRCPVQLRHESTHCPASWRFLADRKAYECRDCRPKDGSGSIAVFPAQFVEIGDVLQFAGSVDRFARISPIARCLRRGPTRQTNDGGRFVFPCELVLDEEFS